MQILLAIDSFKGCLSSEEVEAAFSQALTARGAEVRSLPMSDGGEGMLPACITALHGQLLQAKVHDPLMRPVTACYGIAPDGTAVIETAQACGLTYLSAEERNPLVATTYGVGELVAHAIQHGCRRFLIGLGGSGTSDAGKGMLQGLTDSLAPGCTIEDVLNGPLSDCHFILASDVRNPLYGPEGAAQVFAPQKGATPEMVEELDRRARQFAEESARRMDRDASFQPGAGAAGGLGYAFLQYLQATTQSGADLLLDLCEFDTLLISDPQDLQCEPQELEALLSVLNAHDIHVFGCQRGRWVEQGGRHFAPLPRLSWAEEDILLPAKGVVS